MPQNFQIMLLRALGEVSHKTGTAVDFQDIAAVSHCICQASEAVVTSGDVAEGLAGTPIVGACGRNVGPGKRFGGVRLIGSIHPQSVMCACSAKCVAVRRIVRDINTAAGIDEPTAAIHGETQTQGIGMSVTAAANPLRAGVENELLWHRLGVSED